MVKGWGKESSSVEVGLILVTVVVVLREVGGCGRDVERGIGVVVGGVEGSGKGLKEGVGEGTGGDGGGGSFPIQKYVVLTATPF